MLILFLLLLCFTELKKQQAKFFLFLEFGGGCGNVLFLLKRWIEDINKSITVQLGKEKKRRKCKNIGLKWVKENFLRKKHFLIVQLKNVLYSWNFLSSFVFFPFVVTKFNFCSNRKISKVEYFCLYSVWIQMKYATVSTKRPIG